jgi:uncharacterized membrane protein YjfL (UPF0719 family)
MIGSELFYTLALWFIRALISSIICLIIGYLGIRGISLITSKVNEFESIKGHSVATSLFLGGFFIYAGLVIYGSLVNPFFLSQSVSVMSFFNLTRLGVVVLSFIVSFVFGSILHFIFTRIHLFDLNFDDINNDPLAIGIFLFCYQVFLGLIIFASLNVPLG